MRNQKAPVSYANSFKRPMHCLFLQKRGRLLVTIIFKSAPIDANIHGQYYCKGKKIYVEYLSPFSYNFY